MNLKWMIPIIVVFLLIPMASAESDMGNTPLRIYVNPCTVFMTESPCVLAGCNWCNNNCQSGDCVTGTGTTFHDIFNITIIIRDPDKIKNTGEMDFSLFLENNNSYVVKGTVWTWFVNKASGKEYNRRNESVYIETRSAQMLNITEFLFLVPGEYDLMVENIRVPSRVKDVAETTFFVKTSTGFIPAGTVLDPSEIFLMFLFISLIIIVAFVILMLMTDYYKYFFISLIIIVAFVILILITEYYR